MAETGRDGLAEGRLSATEPVFLLKFMPFCRRVLHLIGALAFQGSPLRNLRWEGAGPQRHWSAHSPPPAGSGSDAQAARFLPAHRLPVGPRFGLSLVNMAGAWSLSLGGRVCAAVARRGFATRGVAGPGSVGREPDPDFDWEPEERELQEVERYRLLPESSA